MARQHAPRLVKGSYRIRYHVEVNGERVRKSETFATKEEAEAVLRERQGQRSRQRLGLALGIPVPSTRTLAEEAADWIETRPPERQRDDRPHLDNHILPYFGHVPMANVKAHVQKFIRHLEQKRAARPNQKNGDLLSGTTIVRILATLRKLCNDCSSELTVHYEDKRPKLVVEDEDEGPLQFIERAEDIAAFIAACRVYQPEWFVIACALSLYGGLRAGEAAGLRRASVDFKRGTVLVNRSYDGTPKSGKPRRVPLPPELAAILRVWFNQSEGSHVVMIDGEPATPTDTAGWSRRVSRVCRHASIDEVVFHALRHTYASHLVMAGVSLYQVQELLGHSSPVTTQIYAHLSPDHLARDTRLHLSFASNGAAASSNS